MNIIIVDDETRILRHTESIIRDVFPYHRIWCFDNPDDAIVYASANHIDIAFLDIEMGGMNGLELAKRLKDIYAKTNIIFATVHSEYALNAYALQASDYLLKPVNKDMILKAIDTLRFLPEPAVSEEPATSLLTVQCFGNFDVFKGGRLLHFPRSKSKELLAYLIHKRGTSCTIKEIAAVLFEGKEDSSLLQKQIQVIIADMMKVLKKEGAQELIIKSYNNIAVNPLRVICDYYRFLQGETKAVNTYMGEYMSNYSWAEFALDYLDRKMTLLQKPDFFTRDF